MEVGEHVAVELYGTGEDGVVLARAAAHAVQEVVDLVKEGGEERALVFGEKRDEAAETGVSRLGIRGSETRYPSLAIKAMAGGLIGKFLDGLRGIGNGFHLSAPELVLLLVEEREQAAVA